MFGNLAEAVDGRDLHDRSAAFLAALEEIGLLHLRKGSDYGRDDDPFANITQSTAWGIPAWQGAMMRAGDKVVRLQTYARTGVLSNEGAEDAALDLASYALIALVLLREQAGLNLAGRSADTGSDPAATADGPAPHGLLPGDRVAITGDVTYHGMTGRVITSTPAHVWVAVDGVGPTWVMAQHVGTVHPDT